MTKSLIFPSGIGSTGAIRLFEVNWHLTSAMTIQVSRNIPSHPPTPAPPPPPTAPHLSLIGQTEFLTNRQFANKTGRCFTFLWAMANSAQPASGLSFLKTLPTGENNSDFYVNDVNGT